MKIVINKCYSGFGLSPKAIRTYSELKIVEIPDDAKWELDEYDGIESIHEMHRSW